MQRRDRWTVVVALSLRRKSGIVFIVEIQGERKKRDTQSRGAITGTGDATSKLVTREEFVTHHVNGILQGDLNATNHFSTPDGCFPRLFFAIQGSRLRFSHDPRLLLHNFSWFARVSPSLTVCATAKLCGFDVCCFCMLTTRWPRGRLLLRGDIEKE